MRTSCIRCGICCKKGGPAFHLEDRHLIEDGLIPAQYLYTIRKGEPVSDNVKGGIVPAGSDIIKIKGKSDSSWECYFFDDTSGCTIYEHRPAECRALKCWDTRDIKMLYAENRLTRKDLLGNTRLWELIEDHDSRCAYPKEMNADISEIIRYDDAFRELLAEKGVVRPDRMDFLFGRPLRIAIRFI